MFNPPIRETIRLTPSKPLWQFPKNTDIFILALVLVAFGASVFVSALIITNTISPLTSTVASLNSCNVQLANVLPVR